MLLNKNNKKNTHSIFMVLVLKKFKGFGLGKDGLGLEKFTRSWSCR